MTRSCFPRFASIVTRRRRLDSLPRLISRTFSVCWWSMFRSVSEVHCLFLSNTRIRIHLSRLVEVVLRLGRVGVHDRGVGRRNERIRLEDICSSPLPFIPTMPVAFLHVSHSPEGHRRRFCHQPSPPRLRILRFPRRFTGVSVFFGPQRSSIGTCVSGFIATASSFPPLSHRSKNSTPLSAAMAFSVRRFWNNST